MAETTLLRGNRGDDRLEGGAGTDTYVFSYSPSYPRYGYGTDTIVDEAGETMTLRFVDSRYAAVDFTEASTNFARVGNNLEITIDKISNDDITDKIAILDAFDTDPNTGTGQLGVHHQHRIRKVQQRHLYRSDERLLALPVSAG